LWSDQLIRSLPVFLRPHLRVIQINAGDICSYALISFTFKPPGYGRLNEGVKFIDREFMQECWQKAQTSAHFKHIAWNVRIEAVKGNIEKYFTKYLTKLVGGKDEIPRPENWAGRYVRYSKKFFGVGISTKDILQALLVQRNLDNDTFFARSYVQIFPKWGVHSAMGQGMHIEAANRQELRALNSDLLAMKCIENGGVIEHIGHVPFYQTSV